MIIAISGKAQNGKDTFARLLGEAAVEDSYFVKYKNFADGIKKTAKIMFNLNDIDFDNKEKYIAWCDMTIREIYQKIGTECGRDVFFDDFWIKWLEQDISGTTMSDKHIILISDERFKNECDWVAKKGGINIRIKRQDIEIKESRHASEIGLDDVKDYWFDFVINNNKGLDELRLEAIKTWKEIRRVYDNNM